MSEKNHELSEEQLSQINGGFLLDNSKLNLETLTGVLKLTLEEGETVEQAMEKAINQLGGGDGSGLNISLSITDMFNILNAANDMKAKGCKNLEITLSNGKYVSYTVY